MKVCEYFLPCGRCDKFNKPCDLTVKDLENYKIMMGEDPSKTKNECEHEWLFYKSTESTGGKCIYYRCCKCGAMMVEDYNGTIYESGEWKP